MILAINGFTVHLHLFCVILFHASYLNNKTSVLIQRHVYKVSFLGISISVHSVLGQFCTNAGLRVKLKYHNCY